MQITLQLDTNSSRDLSLLSLILSHTADTLDRMQPKPQTVEEQFAAARATIPGTPVDLKNGAPENKLMHLVETKAADEAAGIPPVSGFVETSEPPPAAAPEPSAEKPKRTRTPKPAVVKTVTADEVRALMVARSSKGPEEIARQKRILLGMNYEKLSQVPPERLVELKTLIEAE